ncbi:MAG TPA: NAD(P)-binding domain-containing protein [Methyloceanibacter sp.]|nr:NAD(P)-binding domain-containing protein [Methyloceanibacter sp.]
MKRFCIIGAGACGLAVVKTFAERGIPFDCFEAEGDVGGIWNPDSPHVVYGSTHLNSSKKLSRYPDFKFPDEMPYYVSAAQAEEYLRAYAAEYGLYDRITFNARVKSAERTNEGWRIAVEGEAESRLYDGLVVANGHHWQAKLPDYPGTFDGEMVHSHDIKSKAQFEGKRVLVVGAGNSAVDILSDAANLGEVPVHSMRRSYYFFPKMLFGKPTDAVIDRLSQLPLPRRFMYAMYKLGMRVLVGAHRHYGLEAPDHDLFEAHPTACTTYLDHLVHGRIVAKPGIERFEGKRVYFVDDSWVDVDMVIWATGYSIAFPFMDDGYILDENGRSKLFIHTFDREYDDFFVCGLFEPAEGGVWQIADYQARLIAAFIVACETDKKRADWFRKLKAHAKPDIGHGIKYQDTPWHKFEIHHLRFRRYMGRLLKKFGPCAGEEQEMRTMGETAEEREAEKLKLAS